MLQRYPSPPAYGSEINKALVKNGIFPLKFYGIFLAALIPF